MWQGVLTSWYSHFPGLPDLPCSLTSHLHGEEGMEGLGFAVGLGPKGALVAEKLTKSH